MDPHLSNQDHQRNLSDNLSEVRRNGEKIQSMSDAQRTPEICFAAVAQNGFAIAHLTLLQRTPNVCLAAVRQNGRAMAYLDPEDLTRDVVKSAIEQNPNVVSMIMSSQNEKNPLIIPAIEAYAQTLLHVQAQDLRGDDADELCNYLSENPALQMHLDDAALEVLQQYQVLSEADTAPAFSGPKG